MKEELQCSCYSPAEGRVEEFSAVIAVFHLLLRCSHTHTEDINYLTFSSPLSRFVSIHQLYGEWLGRGGLVTLHSLQQVNRTRYVTSHLYT